MDRRSFANTLVLASLATSSKIGATTKDAGRNHDTGSIRDTATYGRERLAIYVGTEFRCENHPLSLQLETLLDAGTEEQFHLLFSTLDNDGELGEGVYFLNSPVSGPLPLHMSPAILENGNPGLIATVNHSTG